MLIALTLLFASCQSSGEFLDADSVWQSEYIHSYAASDVRFPVMINGNIYYFSETPGRGASELCLFVTTLDSEQGELVDKYSPSQIPDNAPEGSSYRIADIAPLDDATLLIAEYGDFSYYDEYNSAWIGDVQNIIRKIDVSTGEIIQTINLTPIMEQYPNIQIEHIAATPNGMLCAALRNFESADNSFVLAAFNANGSLVAASDTAESNVFGENIALKDLITLSDGNVAAFVTTSSDGAELRMFDINTALLSGNATVLPYSFGSIVGTTADGEILSANDIGLYIAAPGQSEAMEFLNWLDCDIDSSVTQFIGITDDGSVICSTMVSDASSVEPYFIIVRKVPKSEIKSKIELTLACVNFDYTVRAEILNFNKANTEYRIKIVDYDQYNTSTDKTAGILKLNTEIISGNMPDMILLDGLPYNSYATRGVLEDLYPFLDNDEELGGRSAVLEAVLKAATDESGKLFRLASSFSILTVMANAEYTGLSESWTIEDLTALLSINSESEAFGSHVTRDDVLREILEVNTHEYVDYNTGNVQFDTEAFAQTLEFLKTLPITAQQSITDVITEDEWMKLCNGVQLGRLQIIKRFVSFMENAALLDNNEVYKGYPCDSGKGSSFFLYDQIAMTTQCKDKEGAWTFIRRLVGTNYQSQHAKALPTNRQLFDVNSQDLMSPLYISPNYDESGNALPFEPIGEFEYCRVDENGNIESPRGYASIIAANYEYTHIPFYAMTQEQYGRFMAFLNSIDRVWSQDNILSKIVTDELSPFFLSQKDAASTVKVIQSRTEIYVNEHR
jgi:ABC-type glycerol-3-phosphate transport system substrate-binding protein